MNPQDESDPGISRTGSAEGIQPAKLTLGNPGDTCVICGGPADWFSDETSKKEYEISRMCQSCQDFTFGPMPKKGVTP